MKKMKSKIQEYLKTPIRNIGRRTIVKITLLSVIAIGSVNTAAVASDTGIMTTVHEKYKTESFKVYGNCQMCEKRIEGALKGVKGVEKADWDKDTKMMQVTYDPESISLLEIKQKIANAGHDTDNVRAVDKTYNGLPGCCQYDRPDSKEEHQNHKH